jgi:hypothetical protein
MTQQEFTQRTMVEVSNNEFWAINEVYNNSDLNKDEFCKMWCKMNASRVDAAKRKIKEQQKDEKCRYILNKWFESWRTGENLRKSYDVLLVYTKLPKGFVEALARFDITIPSMATVSDIYYQVGEELGYFEPFVEG